MLELREITCAYGGIAAVRSLSLTVNDGEVVALLGANGAGKSTTLRTISGLMHPRSGSIFFDGKNITRAAPDKIVRAGVVHVPEGRQVFARLSVLQNLMLGAYARGARSGIHDDLARIYDLFPILKERSAQLAGSFSGGEQQMLAIGRGLMSRPAFLMLDEPSLGLAPIVVERIFDAIDEINEQGTTILLVEQNARLALEFSDRAYVLVTGELALSGASDELLEMPSVREAYLGQKVG
jgi:branched-chain amino acid transport system ATP-binding protein